MVHLGTAIEGPFRPAAFLTLTANKVSQDFIESARVGTVQFMLQGAHKAFGLLEVEATTVDLHDDYRDSALHRLMDLQQAPPSQTHQKSVREH